MHAASKEYETEIHFQKCYGVMAEIFDEHNNLDDLLPAEGYRFLDLGCAPGGFSSFLLEDHRCKSGFGVTLPALSGGFPVRVRSDRFFLQQADLFEVGPADLLASDVHVCICDAQYLRNNISWDDKYRGVRCRSKQHGVWALLAKQFWLGLSKLLTGGILIFRFGWRDPGPEDPATVWYKRQTLRLFTLLHDVFEEVREIKSDYFNALQSSFYVCCLNFDRDRFQSRQIAKLLGYAFNYLVTTEIQDASELEIFHQVDKIRSSERDGTISAMLDRINKLRLVHEQSRERHKKSEARREDPRAVLLLAGLPEGMSNQELQDAMAKFGRVLRIDRDNDGAEASVQFAFPEHAQTAAYALGRGGTAEGSLAQDTRAWLRGDDQGSQDNWSQEWQSQKRASSGAWQNGDSWHSRGANGWHGCNGGYSGGRGWSAASWSAGDSDSSAATTGAHVASSGGPGSPATNGSDSSASSKGSGRKGWSPNGYVNGSADADGKGYGRRRKGYGGGWNGT